MRCASVTTHSLSDGAGGKIKVIDWMRLNELIFDGVGLGLALLSEKDGL